MMKRKKIKIVVNFLFKNDERKAIGTMEEKKEEEGKRGGGEGGFEI